MLLLRQLKTAGFRPISKYECIACTSAANVQSGSRGS